MTTEDLQQESSLADDLAAGIDESLDEATAEEPEISEEEQEQVQEMLESLEPPPKWDKRYKEVFQGWAATDEEGNPLYQNGREWQQAVLDLYKEQQGYATKVEQERAEARKQAEQYQQYLGQFRNVISPYQQFLQETGATPDVAIRQGMGLLQALRNDPQATLLRLAREANVDLQAALSEQPWQSPESKQVEDLKRQLMAMQQQQAQREQRQVQEQMQRARAENAAQIKAFAEATDESGTPLHPHLETVQETMAELIYGRENLRKSNPELPSMGLDEAYERAIRLHPDLVQKSETEKEVQRLSQKAAEAKKAASASKRVKPSATKKVKDSRSLQDQLSEAYDKSNAA